jgi:hypothetical protein
MAKLIRLALRELDDAQAALCRQARDDGDILTLTDTKAGTTTHWAVESVACDDGGKWRAVCWAVTVLKGGPLCPDPAAYRRANGRVTAEEIAIQVKHTGMVAFHRRDAKGIYVFARQVPLDDCNLRDDTGDESSDGVR